ncbi:hypothetical protein CPB83DRAFT_852371 [Crepidotus variabilis]|uniref:Uncharacterized protein n=1 Tax=Crepidotus variabilis TaxID=179855 RepID=A0A9P6JQF6_9AGAR|nr:hypothetical protein CPB83DRAFT_852371 [Crepidotus variabilis]
MPFDSEIVSVAGLAPIPPLLALFSSSLFVWALDLVPLMMVVLAFVIFLTITGGISGSSPLVDSQKGSNHVKVNLPRATPSLSKAN